MTKTSPHPLQFSSVRYALCLIVDHLPCFIVGLKDKTNVLRELQEAAVKCDDIARVLGIRNAKIETTHQEHPICEERLKEYVDEWLKGNAEMERTWVSLCKVLRDPLVGRKDVADKIAAKFSCKV